MLPQYLGAARYSPDDTSLKPKSALSRACLDGSGSVTLCVEVSAMPEKAKFC
jgi:hypothetical protein